MLFISMTLLRAMNASGAGRHGWAPMNSANLYGGGGVCVCSCMRVCTYVGMRACVMCLQYNDNKTRPRLIMIIIKIISLPLYFMQIRDTDDFPSTGTRLVRLIMLVLLKL